MFIAVKRFTLLNKSRVTRQGAVLSALQSCQGLSRAVISQSQYTGTRDSTSRRYIANAAKDTTRNDHTQGNGGLRSPISTRFWTCRTTWSRSIINTFRCLVGCTSGDFAMMWYLQSAYLDLDVMTTMGLSSKSISGFPDHIKRS